MAHRPYSGIVQKGIFTLLMEIFPNKYIIEYAWTRRVFHNYMGELSTKEGI